MRYRSTRGGEEGVDWEEAVGRGLARDGGLYVPEGRPRLRAGVLGGVGGYAELASECLEAFGAFGCGDAMEGAYGSGYERAATAPLRQVDEDVWLLELCYGPSLSFKDMAMRGLAGLGLMGGEGGGTALCATSGDTGAAAISAFGGSGGGAVVVLFPEGGVSEEQRRQMTCSGKEGVYAVSVEGTFDDCQRMVKSAFRDEGVREGAGLVGLNSINWGRVALQTTYYAWASGLLGGGLGRSVDFVVPTGNFGNAYSGLTAMRMGVPEGRLWIAVNENDVLHRALETGEYEPREVVATRSPSMDIQAPSNFERALYDACGGDSERVRGMTSSMEQGGVVKLEADVLEWLRERFGCVRVGLDEASAAMKRARREGGVIVDPHTAVGLGAAWSKEGSLGTPKVVLATAHPAKFKEAVEGVLGEEVEKPAVLRELEGRREDVTRMSADEGELRSFLLGVAKGGP